MAEMRGLTPASFLYPQHAKGGHIHTELQGAGSAVLTLKNRWEVRSKGGITTWGASTSIAVCRVIWAM